MALKRDSDFAAFISIGAIGSAAVAEHLRDEHGHVPIELERYSMSNKIWRTRVKRLRVPDLVCISCGRRIESRAKRTQLGIILSDSTQPGRGWDHGGMRELDLYAFISVESATDIGTPSFFTQAAMRSTLGLTKQSARGGTSEGSEVSLQWPAWVPSASGAFVGCDEEGNLIWEAKDGSRRTYWQWKRWGGLVHTYLQPGEEFAAGNRLVAGVAAPAPNLDCEGSTWDLERGVASTDQAEQCGAIKAAGLLGRTDLLTPLTSISMDHSTDWRVRLEALIALARLTPELGTQKLVAALDESFDQPQQLEMVLGLSEVDHIHATESLVELAARVELGSEIRAAAAWELGRRCVDASPAVLNLTIDDDPLVASHALARIHSLSAEMADTLAIWIGKEDRRGAVAAKIFERTSAIDLLLEACESTTTARSWAIRALGALDSKVVSDYAGRRLSEDLRQRLDPFWFGQQDWFSSEAGRVQMRQLDRQKFRSDHLQNHPPL